MEFELQAQVGMRLFQSERGQQENQGLRRAEFPLARLRPQVDAFFDGVMVNVDDPAIRANRLALLKRLAERLGSVAAIEHLSA